MKANYEDLAKTAEESGFTNFAPMDVNKLEFLQEIRDMCNAQQCKNYDTSWSCPPACAPIEDMQLSVKKYTKGILVQTVGDLEDSFDWDGIMETGARHKINFRKMREVLNRSFSDLMALGAGECKVCETCTYPDKPCRYPDKMETSMEACGLFVSRVCTDNDLAYNYGPDKIAFTSCFLLKEEC